MRIAFLGMNPIFATPTNFSIKFRPLDPLSWGCEPRNLLHQPSKYQTYTQHWLSRLNSGIRESTLLLHSTLRLSVRRSAICNGRLNEIAEHAMMTLVSINHAISADGVVIWIVCVDDNARTGRKMSHPITQRIFAWFVLAVPANPRQF